MPRGFSMVEVMAAVAIMAILAMVAIPSIQDSLMRKQVLEALPLANIAKGPVAQSWALTQTFPADNAAAGLPVAEKIVSNFVSGVAVENGAIQITFGNRAYGLLKGKVLSLRPAVVDDAPIVPVAWVCGGAQAPGQMTVHGVNQTSLLPKHLPLECRGADAK